MNGDDADAERPAMTPETARQTTVDDREIADFAAMADDWWDPDGPFAPLHRLNPVRLQYIRDKVVDHFALDGGAIRAFAGLRAADVGCGGGLLSEPLARLGADVTAIDAGAETVAAAAAHARSVGLEIDYRQTTAEALAQAEETFDVVVSMEVLEHVADPQLFLRACARLVRPGGVLLLATLNRTVKSYALAIVGAEYVLRWLPQGTHHWDKFIRPAELARYLRRTGMTLEDLTGVTYRPLDGSWQLSRDVDVNYMACAVASA
jgi:2-polyprenyl-6-hydroxyphenyl methylase/3-demethylubiquinone-9 3-methyltransferase